MPKHAAKPTRARSASREVGFKCSKADAVAKTTTTRRNRPAAGSTRHCKLNRKREAGKFFCFLVISKSTKPSRPFPFLFNPRLHLPTCAHLPASHERRYFLQMPDFSALRTSQTGPL